MASVLSITFPIFATIGLGFGAVRFRIFRAEDLRALSSFVMVVALPALIFNAVSSAAFGDLVDWGYVGAYLAGSMAMMLLAFAAFRGQRLTVARSAVAAMGTALSNSGYVGYPILLLAYPALAQRVLALNMSVENFVLVPAALVLLSLDVPATEGAGRFHRLGRIVKSVLTRPMVIAFLVALPFSLTGAVLPDALRRLVQLLSAATAPIALFYIGGALAGLPLRGNKTVAAQIVVAKLFLHPLMILAAAALFGLAGVAVAPDLRAPLILTAAMPMLGIYAILAAEKGHEGMASLALLGATLVSFFSVSGLLAILR